MGDGGAAANGLDLESCGYKKTAPYPTWDKSLTPAIPPKLTFSRPLASRAITRARWITGGSPSASTRLPVQAALERPFTRPRPALISPPRTLFGFAAPATLLSHRFGLDLLVGAIICTAFWFVNPFFHILQKGRLTPAAPLLCIPHYSSSSASTACSRVWPSKVLTTRPK